MKGRDVLLERIVLDVLDRTLRERRADDVGLTLRFGERQHQIRLGVSQKVVRTGAFFGAREADLDVVPHAVDPGVADALVAKLRAQVRRGRVGALRDRRSHVDLEEEVHAASQVKPQIHRERVDREEPLRRVGHEVQGDDVARILRIGIQRLVDHFAGAELLFGLRRVKAHADRILLRALLEEDAVRFQVGFAQGALDARQRVFGHLDGGLPGRHLHGGGFAVEVGQRVDQAEDQRDADQDIFPKWVAIHPKLQNMRPSCGAHFARIHAGKRRWSRAHNAFRGSCDPPCGRTQNLTAPFGRTACTAARCMRTVTGRPSTLAT